MGLHRGNSALMEFEIYYTKYNRTLAEAGISLSDTHPALFPKAEHKRTLFSLKYLLYIQRDREEKLSK